jgi:hypothetical protein
VEDDALKADPGCSSVELRIPSVRTMGDMSALNLSRSAFHSPHRANSSSRRHSGAKMPTPRSPLGRSNRQGHRHSERVDSASPRHTAPRPSRSAQSSSRRRPSRRCTRPPPTTERARRAAASCSLHTSRPLDDRPVRL